MGANLASRGGLVVLGAAVAAGGLLWWSFRAEEPSPSRREIDGREPEVEPKAPVSFSGPMSNRLVATERGDDGVVPAQSGAGDVVPQRLSPVHEPSADPMLAPEEVPSYFSSLFAGDSFDPAWARDERRRLSTLAEDSLPEGAALEGVECRSTLCRMQTRFRSKEDSEEFISSMFFGREPVGAMIAPLRVDDGNSHAVTMYIARDGYQLPSVRFADDGELDY